MLFASSYLFSSKSGGGDELRNHSRLSLCADANEQSGAQPSTEAQRSDDACVQTWKDKRRQNRQGQGQQMTAQVEKGSPGFRIAAVAI